MATTTVVAGAVGTGSVLTNEMKTFYEMRMLDRAIAELYYCSLGWPATIPDNQGNVVDWRKVSALSAVTTALTPGVTPASEAFSVVNITATPSQYGAFIRLSDELQLRSIDPLVDEMSRALGEQAGLSADTLARDLYAASGTVQIADGVAARGSLAATNVLDGSEIAKAWATLVNANARGFDFLGGRFAVVLSALAWKDLLDSAEMRNAAQQALPRDDEHPLFSGKVFDYMGCRFFVSSNAKMVADAGAGSTVDVYLTLVIGRQAFGIAGIGAQGLAQRMDLGIGGTGNTVMPVDLIVKQLGYGDDPLNQRSSVGWKGWQEEKELNAAFAVRIEHACSMGSNT